jgi:hypothetical protein
MAEGWSTLSFDFGGRSVRPLLRPNGELGTLILKKEGSGRGEKREGSYDSFLGRE